MTQKFSSLIGLVACVGSIGSLASGHAAESKAATPSVVQTEATPNRGLKSNFPADFPMSKAPYLGVYRWSIGKTGGPIGNAAYAKWLDRSSVWGQDFLPKERWEDIWGGDWQFVPWSKWKKEVEGRQFVLSVPLLPGPWDRSGPKDGTDKGKAVSLEAGARGEYNQHFRKLAENLVRNDLGEIVLRLGWEFNGNWFTWRASENPKAYAAYWRQVVDTMRAVPNTNFQFDFNPSLGYQGAPAEKSYPGDDYVDIVGIDIYDESWFPGTYPIPIDATPEETEKRQRLAWDKVLYAGDHGLKFWSNFCREHKKPMSLPEWGVNIRPDKNGGKDNPYFIEQMHKFITDPANNVYYHVYFDVQAPDGAHQLSPGTLNNQTTIFPRSAERFKALFGNK